MGLLTLSLKKQDFDNRVGTSKIGPLLSTVIMPAKPKANDYQTHQAATQAFFDDNGIKTPYDLSGVQFNEVYDLNKLDRTESRAALAQRMGNFFSYLDKKFPTKRRIEGKGAWKKVLIERSINSYIAGQAYTVQGVEKNVEEGSEGDDALGEAGESANNVDELKDAANNLDPSETNEREKDDDSVVLDAKALDHYHTQLEEFKSAMEKKIAQEYDVLEEKQKAIDSRIKSANEETQKLQSDNNVLQEQCNTFETDKKRLTARFDSIQKEKKKLEDNGLIQEQELDQAKESIRKLSGEVTDLKRRNATAQQAHSTLLDETVELSKEISGLNKTNARLESEKAVLQKNNATLLDEKSQLSGYVSDLKKTIVHLESQKEFLRKNYAALLDEKKQLSAEASVASNTIADLNNQKAALEESNARLANLDRRLSTNELPASFLPTPFQAYVTSLVKRGNKNDRVHFQQELRSFAKATLDIEVFDLEKIMKEIRAGDIMPALKELRSVVGVLREALPSGESIECYEDEAIQDFE